MFLNSYESFAAGQSDVGAPVARAIPIFVADIILCERVILAEAPLPDGLRADDVDEFEELEDGTDLRGGGLLRAPILPLVKL
jgi:hypothetical protein